MIRRSTIVYIVLLLVLAGAYYYLNNREQPADIELTVEPTSQVSYLFTAEEGTPSSIRIKSRSGKIVEVAREADNAWALTQPIEAQADQGSVEAAASQITTMRILDSVSDIDPEIIGLEVPEYVLTVKFTSGVERTVDVGVITPTESGYYVRDAAGQVVIVSRSAIDSLLGVLDNPPYLETPPEAGTLPSETAVP
ncbi:MAG: DUF4340 domain-containing protein [Chloroflexi bacterium]|nr:MAG: DUF4340 domain-containing protein [Chloroflexota bacterium]